MMATESACLLIADISGYTSYLSGVELDHAQDILADLTRTIVTALRPGFRLSKLEGDAAFTYAITDKIDGSMLLDTVERCYFGFRRRRRDMRLGTTCACNACVRIPDLDLKFVVHHGTIMRQHMAGGEELLGADVIVVHRLLKNGVVESTGIEAYSLFTQPCVDAMDVDVVALGMRSAVETYDVIGDVPVWIHDLGRRWDEEEAQTRVIVDEPHTIFRWDIATAAPPMVAWEFMTAPGRRSAWQTGVTSVAVVAEGNRRGVGATTHCMHGMSGSTEEMLDWRPYDYYTIRNNVPTPMGTIRFLQTTEFEPTADGTVVHMRMAAPTSRKELLMMKAAQPMLQAGMRASETALIGQLDEALRQRGEDLPGEPELPQPRPESVLRDLPTWR
jgi:class 3 adenylate cyclase